MYRHRQLILGVLLGAWISFFLLSYLISQEFNPGWTEIPNGYLQLSQEVKDVLIMFPIIILLPTTAFIAGLIYFNKRLEAKSSLKR